MQAARNRLQKVNVHPAASINDTTLVDSAVTVYPVHIDYEEEC